MNGIAGCVRGNQLAILGSLLLTDPPPQAMVDMLYPDLNTSDKACQIDHFDDVAEEIPEIKVAEETENCPICLEKINKKTNFVRTKCGHSFCFDCLNSSLMSNNKCPLCREDIEHEKREQLKKIDMDQGMEVLKIELEEFGLSDHVDMVVDFMPDTPRQQKSFMTREMRTALRLYSRKLLKAFIDYQNNEYVIVDEDEDEEEE